MPTLSDSECKREREGKNRARAREQRKTESRKRACTRGREGARKICVCMPGVFTGRGAEIKTDPGRHETCCKPKSPATSDLQNVRGFRCPCMHTLGHTQTRTHFSHFVSVRVHCECASRVFVACERTFVVILKEEERKVERRRDGGLVGETGGKGDPERGVRRECVCERGGAHCRARSQERKRRYKSFHSENWISRLWSATHTTKDNSQKCRYICLGHAPFWAWYCSKESGPRFSSLGTPKLQLKDVCLVFRFKPFCSLCIGKLGPLFLDHQCWSECRTIIFHARVPWNVYNCYIRQHGIYDTLARVCLNPEVLILFLLLVFHGYLNIDLQGYGTKTTSFGCIFYKIHQSDNCVRGARRTQHKAPQLQTQQCVMRTCLKFKQVSNITSWVCFWLVGMAFCSHRSRSSSMSLEASAWLEYWVQGRKAVIFLVWTAWIPKASLWDYTLPRSSARVFRDPRLGSSTILASVIATVRPS